MIIPPVGRDWQQWAEEIRRYLARTYSRLSFKRPDAVASENGVMLWDNASGYPVVSKGGEWHQVLLADGYAQLSVNTTLTAAAANTAYPITWGSVMGGGLGISGSTITFTVGGVYLLAFTAQVDSGSSSSVTFHFWPRINGADPASSDIRQTLHSANEIQVVTRARVFIVNAGDTLQAMWAVSDTNGQLSAAAATAFAPSTPAATLAITRLRA